MVVSTAEHGSLFSRESIEAGVVRFLLLGLVLLFTACSDSKDSNQEPEFSSDAAISVVEGTTATGYTATATDPDSGDTLTFSVSGGADQALFSIDAASGVLSFVTAPEFDNPADANTDNVYELELSVDDDRSGIATLSLQVTVTSNNQAPVFTSAGTASVMEGTTATGYTATASDANATDTLTFSLSGGADQAQFTLDPASGVLSFNAITDFAVPTDANGDNDYEVQLSVSDGRTGTDTLDLIVTVTEQSNFALSVTYPTPNANLGGGVTTTQVTGNIVDSSGAPIDLATIDFVTVNGQAATLDAANPGRWTAQAAVVDGSNTLALDLGLTSGTVISTTQELQNFAVHVGLGLMALDTANNRALVIDGFVDGVIAVDLTSGARSVLSDDAVGAGTALNSPSDVAVDSANGRALVLDYQRDALVAVDLASGDRSDLSRGTVGTGVTMDGPIAVAVDSGNNRALVITGINNRLISVDLTTGVRTDFSGLGAGAGPDFIYAADVAVDAANNRVLVSDESLPGIFAVDLDSGDRTILSDSATGAGFALEAPIALSLDAPNNRLLVLDIDSNSLVAVDLTTGDRTQLAETETTYGVSGTELLGVAMDSTNNRVLLADWDVDVILAVAVPSGDVTIFSDSATGAGDVSARLKSVGGIAVDAAADRLLLTKGGMGEARGLFAVDLGSGARSLLSNSVVGTGPSVGNPRGIVVDEGIYRAIVVSASPPALFTIDLDSGDRTILSDNNGVGAGPAFNFPGDVFVDADNARAFVLDGALMSVDLNTGDRAIVSDAATGTGPVWDSPESLDVNLATNIAYVVNDSSNAAYEVDLVSGDRSIISDNAGVGTGPSFSSPRAIRLDIAGNRALVLNIGNDNLMAVDLATGDRTLLSGPGIGSGQPLLAPYKFDLDLENSRAFIYDLALEGVIVVELASSERAVTSK